MTLLILCVDRDNDFGVKTGVATPIIGRDANLEAAIGLGLADPEDTDTNALLAAINVYDDLVRQGHQTEIATICGHRNVGSTSDRILAKQLDDVLDGTDPDSCILVTDGAEDEFILPLLTSRVRVDAVKRVIVRQNQDIEGVYYVIKRALEDEKIQRTLFVPIAIALLIYGLATITGNAALGLGAIALSVGGYFFVKGFQLEDAIGRMMADFYNGLRGGRITLFTSLLSAAVLLGGVVFAWQDVQNLGVTATSLAKVIVFLTSLIWWAIGSALLVAAGRVADAWVKEREVLWSYWALPFTLLATGFIFTALLHVAGRIEGDIPTGELLRLDDFVNLVVGSLIAFIGWSTHHYVRSRLGGGDDDGVGRADGATRADGRSRRARQSEQRDSGGDASGHAGDSTGARTSASGDTSSRSGSSSTQTTGPLGADDSG